MRSRATEAQTSLVSAHQLSQTNVSGKTDRGIGMMDSHRIKTLSFVLPAKRAQQCGPGSKNPNNFHHRDLIKSLNVVTIQMICATQLYCGSMVFAPVEATS